MFWKNLMVGQNLMVGHALLGGWKWSELCSVIWHLLVIILMHWVFQFWLWGRFVAEKQTWVLILRPEMTYYENGEKKVCELDHYTDQSYLGIHYWDLVSKVAYPKLKKKLKFKCPDMRNGKDLRRCPPQQIIWDTFVTQAALNNDNGNKNSMDNWGHRLRSLPFLMSGHLNFNFF